MKTAACAGLCLLAGGDAFAAEWLLAPTMRLSTTYVDNPRLLADGGTSSAGAIGALSARLQRRTERTDLLLQPRLSSVRASGDESLESDDQYLDARLGFVTERSQWNAAIGLVNDTTLTSELDSTGLIQTSRRHQSISASGGPTWMLTERANVGVQGYVLDTHYPDRGDTGLVDYQYRVASLSSDFAATERSTVRFSVQGGELVVPDSATRTRDASARIEWQFRSGDPWSTTLSAGPTYVDAPAGQDTGAVFDADAQRRGERWTFNVHAGRNLTPTGRGVLTKRDRAALSVNRRFTTNVSAGASLQWVRNEDLLQQPGIAFAKVDYGRVELNLNWRWSEHWALAFSVGGAASRDHRLDTEADNYNALLGIVWTGRQQSL